MVVMAMASAQANPNYSASTAQGLGLNASTITFQIGVPGEVDWYYLDFPASGTLTIQSLGSTDVHAELRAANGATLAWNDDGAGYPNFKITAAVSTGRYYLLVRHYYSSGTGPYSLRNTFNEKNNSFATAVKLGLNTYSRRFLLAPDTDFYYVDIPSSGQLKVESLGYTDTSAYLFQRTGGSLYEYGYVVVIKNDYGGVFPNFGITVNLRPGRYYLQVQGRNYGSNGTTGVYSLHNTFTPMSF
jgi:hypothetical protein